VLGDSEDARDTAQEIIAKLCVKLGQFRGEVATLPAAQAHVLVLKDALGFSFEEISASSGMPVGTATCYAHRARTTMRELLEEGAAV
jgi:DNA-directed RNA polymerase specialized sigma24 family protein